MTRKKWTMKISKSHPRYESLKIREKLEKGIALGITSLNGLIAHGRGEAFDYLIGEKTHEFAKRAIEATAAQLVLAKHPVISVNGNSAILSAKELVALASLLHAPLEVNIFHASKTREKNIKNHLEKHGASRVLLPQKNYTIEYLASNRKFVNPDGIFIADVVFVPLEDGDRAEALMRNGKKVITIDLNPLSRTAQKSTITIVDNITRAMPLLIQEVKRQQGTDKKLSLQNYDNNEILKQAIVLLRKGC